VKNQFVWVGCIALVAVALVGLILTSVLILEKEERQVVTDPPSTFTNPDGSHAEIDVKSVAEATLNNISNEPVCIGLSSCVSCETRSSGA
jgi:cell division septation protein DedD